MADRKKKKRIATIVIEKKFKFDERVKKISKRVIKHIYTERKCVYDEMKTKLFSIKQECNFTA